MRAKEVTTRWDRPDRVFVLLDGAFRVRFCAYPEGCVLVQKTRGRWADGVPGSVRSGSADEMADRIAVEAVR